MILIEIYNKMLVFFLLWFSKLILIKYYSKLWVSLSLWILEYLSGLFFIFNSSGITSSNLSILLIISEMRICVFSILDSTFDTLNNI